MNRRRRRGRSPPTRSRPPNPRLRRVPTGAYAARDSRGDATARCPSPSAPFAPPRRPAGWDPAPVRPAARGGGRRAPRRRARRRRWRTCCQSEDEAAIPVLVPARRFFPRLRRGYRRWDPCTRACRTPARTVPPATPRAPPRFSPSRSSPWDPRRRACATASVPPGSRRPRRMRTRPASSGAGSCPAATTPRLTGTAWSARTRDVRAPPPSRRARAATRPRCPVRSGTRSSSPRRLCRARSPRRLARFLRVFRLRRPPPPWSRRPNHRSRGVRR